MLSSQQVILDLRYILNILKFYLVFFTLLVVETFEIFLRLYLYKIKLIKLHYIS